MTTTHLTDIGACVFDAYGTLFDITAAARRLRDKLGDKVEPLAEIWRRKQLEYTWLRSLLGRYEDFWQVTGDALDYAMGATGLANPGLRAQLMQLYLALDAYPEVAGVLTQLKAAKMPLAILSNGSTTMLISAAKSAGIMTAFNEILSADSLKIYKPSPSVYQLACDRLNLPAGRICYLSSNPWDVACAAAFGYRVVWVNRTGGMREILPGEPVAEMRALAELPALLGLKA